MYNIEKIDIDSIGLGYGELVLKGKNRKDFENNIKNKIKEKLKNTKVELVNDNNKIYLKLNGEKTEDIIEKIKKVFGINNINLAISTSNDINEIKEKMIEIANKLYEIGARNFKVVVNRSNKSFPINSMDFAKEMGANILINTKFTDVKMKNADVIINLDIRNKTYISTEKIKLYGGMPLGSSGNGLSLISGGIDSPVASFMMSKRGLKLAYATFHSFPYTSKMAVEKVKKLVEKLAEYNGKSVLYLFNILPLQNAIKEHTNEIYTTILTRRAMMKIAEKISKKYNYEALVTGESLGQVASQTLKGLNCTNNAVNIPVFRPLIGTDKLEIMEIAKEIDTYDISILPYQDSCEMFAPKSPSTNPKLEKILEEEKRILNYDEIIEEIIKNVEIYIAR